VVPKQIFVSYSREDDEWRARLLQALAPIARADEIDVWDDRNIAPGERQPERIEEQIARSNVAVLLVSAQGTVVPRTRAVLAINARHSTERA
jgi:hypothetical protein